MKRVLLITSEAVHRHLYERGLKKHFDVECADSPTGAARDLDAIVYDVPKRGNTLEFRWFEDLALPLVVLVPTEWMRVPETPRRRVLAYPVSMDRIIKALAELGVKADPK